MNELMNEPGDQGCKGRPCALDAFAHLGLAEAPKEQPASDQDENSNLQRRPSPRAVAAQRDRRPNEHYKEKPEESLLQSNRVRTSHQIKRPFQLSLEWPFAGKGA